ncbi:Spo0E family sporulation regulatory protein-aspartic acid phosphatase [Niallia oryzisoli]|uniref:Spo0E family sporulation regulatory protein-aspartic acid phosphatase n=1 Tax=Niallia oryzisoli TaxID=1737571 RepID=UPI0037352180
MDILVTNHPLFKTKLLQHIQSLREQLVLTGLKEGLNNEKTIHLSQELDEYIYLYQSFEKQSCIGTSDN